VKFDELYPEATVNSAPMIVKKPNGDYEGYCVIKLDNPVPCWHCGENTQWVELNFEAPLCYGECETAKWAEYRSALLQ
jgi:hypothetical protein